jgi:chemotaxis protein CheC
MIGEEKAATLADLIIPMDISAMEEGAKLQLRDSALSEQGNIILGAFLNALAQITGWVLPTTTPAVARDMLGSIMDLAGSMFGVIGDSALLVRTSLHVKGLDDELGGTVIMIPDPGSLEALLAKLGVL